MDVCFSFLFFSSHLILFLRSSSCRWWALCSRVVHREIKSKSNTISRRPSRSLCNLKTDSCLPPPAASKLRISYAGGALASPPPHPLTGTMAARLPQKTVFYSDTRPQSRTDSVSDFMVRYEGRLMFSCESASLRCLLLSVDRPIFSLLLLCSPFFLCMKNPWRHGF